MSLRGLSNSRHDFPDLAALALNGVSQNERCHPPRSRRFGCRLQGLRRRGDQPDIHRRALRLDRMRDVEQAFRGQGQLNAVSVHNRPRSAGLRGTRNRWTGSNQSGIVARNIADDQRQDASGKRRGRQTTCLDVR